MSEPTIHPSASVDPSATLGEGVVLGPGCVVLAHAHLGARTRLLANATVCEHTTLGEGNLLHPGAVLGGPPQDKTWRGEATTLEIGSRNEFREGVTVHRGTVKGGGVTRVGDDNLLMACSHVGHDCQVGDRVILSNNVLLAGHVDCGDGAVLGGAAAFHHFVRIGRLAYVGGMSRCVHDVPPALKVSGDPGRPRAVNEVGLRRAGESEETVQGLRSLYQRLFMAKAPLAQVLEELPVGAPGTFEAEILQFLREWVSSSKGRYLEGFRQDRAR